MKALRNYFVRMGFKRQLILTFVATTLLTLVISIIVIKEQIGSVREHTDMDLKIINSDDYQTATCLTAKTIKSGLLSYFFMLSQLLEQLSLSQEYFGQSPNSYASNETDYPLLFTANYTAQPDFSAPAQFIYNSSLLQNCYPSYSFFDVQLPYMFSTTPTTIKRINVLFINPQNLNATCIHTIPATSNFSINDTSTFQSLLRENSQNEIYVSLPYEDPYSSSGQLLMYLGESIPVNSTLTIVLQMELDIYAIEKFFYKRVIYFPNAVVGYVYTDPSNNQSEIYSVSNTSLTYNVTELMANNGSVITVNGTEYVVGLSSFPDKYPIDDLTYLLSTPTGPYTVFVLGEIGSMNTPPITLMNFLDRFSFICNYAYGLCAIVTLMTVITFAYVAANAISSPLSKLSKNVGKFLEDTKDATSIQVTMVQIEPKHQLKTLTNNIVSILEQIEQQRYNNRDVNLSTDLHEFPVNDCDSEFLKKMRSKALSVWPSVEEQLKKREAKRQPYE